MRALGAKTAWTRAHAADRASAMNNPRAAIGPTGPTSGRTPTLPQLFAARDWACTGHHVGFPTISLLHGAGYSGAIT